MKVFARTLSKQVINVSFAFIVAFSSLTAVMPFVMSDTANATSAESAAGDQDTSSTVIGTDSDVKGEDVKKEAVGNIFGLAWYWWLLIVAALGALIWWIVSAIRNRDQQHNK